MQDCSHPRKMHMVGDPTYMTCRYCGDFDSPEGEWFEWEGAWHCFLEGARLKVTSRGFADLYDVVIDEKWIGCVTGCEEAKICSVIYIKGLEDASS